MLAIDVELLHGIFVGTGADDHAITGQPMHAEWPPSPARLFSALVAGGGTGDRNRVGTNDDELRVLERLAPPLIVASSRSDVRSTSAVPRFVVIDERVKRGKAETEEGAVSSSGLSPVKFVQNYPARAAQESRGAPTASPRDSRITYEWPDANIDVDEVESLRRRAERVGYFGCSDAPARLRVRTGGDTVPGTRTRWVPGLRGSVELSVPTPGLLDLLDSAFTDWSKGNARRRSWLPVAIMSYSVEASESRRRMPSWRLEFERPVSARHSIRVTDAIRNALLNELTEVVGSGDAISEVVHGHVREGIGADHLHIAALPFVGRRHADGLVRGAMLMLPASTPRNVVDDVDLAVTLIDHVWARSERQHTIFDVGVREADSRSAFTVRAGRWCGSSTLWASATPIIVERRRKGGPSHDDVEAWLARQGVATEFEFRWSPVPVVDGGWSFEPLDVFRRVEQRRPYGYLTLRFAERVTGPLLLGRGRHYGMGLMAPGMRDANV